MTRPVRLVQKVTGVSALAWACGCGASGATDDAPATPELSDAERAELDAEVASMQQNLGEASCATTAADATFDFATATTNFVYSPAPNYDHPTCRDAYVVDIKNLAETRHIWASGEGPQNLDPFGCLFTITAATLYKKQGADYVKVGDASALGSYPWPGSSGWQCVSRVSFANQPPGDYKIAMSSAQFLGGKKRVGTTVTTVPWPP